MDNPKKIFWVLLVLLLAVVIILTLHKKQALKNGVVLIKPADQTNADSAMPTTNGSQRPATAPIQTNTSVRIKSWVDSLPKEEKLRLATAAHNVPIDFWGKVIDQDGVPLGGVKVVIVITNPVNAADSTFTRSYLQLQGCGNKPLLAVE